MQLIRQTSVVLSGLLGTNSVNDGMGSQIGLLSREMTLQARPGSCLLGALASGNLRKGLGRQRRTNSET